MAAVGDGRPGLAFGGFLLAFLGSPVLDPANADFVLLGDAVLDVGLFSGLFLAFGLGASRMLSLLDARFAPPPPSRREGGPSPWSGRSRSSRGSRRGTRFSPELGLTLLGASVATVGANRLERHGRPDAARLVRAGATAALVAVTAFAGADTLDGVRTIL